MHRVTHMEDSPHKCDTCGRSFNQRSNLKTHLLTHTDIKSYNCNDCGKRFRRNCDLRRHTLTHTLGIPESQVPVESNDSCCSLPEYNVKSATPAVTQISDTRMNSKDDDVDVVN